MTWGPNDGPPGQTGLSVVTTVWGMNAGAQNPPQVSSSQGH